MQRNHVAQVDPPVKMVDESAACGIGVGWLGQKAGFLQAERQQQGGVLQRD